MLRQIRKTTAVQIIENDDFSPGFSKQTIDKVAADKPRSTGDDHSVGALVHMRGSIRQLPESDRYQHVENVLSRLQLTRFTVKRAQAKPEVERVATFSTCSQRRD